jgi:hypothetical protein
VLLLLPIVRRTAPSIAITPVFTDAAASACRNECSLPPFGRVRLSCVSFAFATCSSDANGFSSSPSSSLASSPLSSTLRKRQTQLSITITCSDLPRLNRGCCGRRRRSWEPSPKTVVVAGRGCGGAELVSGESSRSRLCELTSRS